MNTYAQLVALADRVNLRLSPATAVDDPRRRPKILHPTPAAVHSFSPAVASARLVTLEKAIATGVGVSVAASEFAAVVLAGGGDDQERHRRNVKRTRRSARDERRRQRRDK